MRMARRRSRLASPIRQSGRRNSGSSMPIMAMASFTGMGLVSMNTARQSGKSRRWSSRASFQSPASAAWVISAVSRGTMLAITEMTPRPPTDMSGSVRLSSPDTTEKSGPQARITWVIWSRDPEASFTPTMVGQSFASRWRMEW